MVKPADLRNRDQLAAVRRLDGASIRAVFVERQMGARVVTVIDVRRWLDDLAGEPTCGRMLRDVQMQNLPSSVAEDDAHVEQTKRGGDDHKRVDGGDAVHTTRPNSVEPIPEQAVATTNSRSAGPLPMENGHLMSEGEHLQFQGSPTPKPEGDQRNHCRQDRKHGGHAKAAGGKTPTITHHTAL